MTDNAPKPGEPGTVTSGGSTATIERDPNSPANRTNEDNPVEAPTDVNEDLDETEDKVETVTVDRDFIYMHNLDPARQIPGTSKYLDVEQRKEAEIQRAAIEGRKPDLENPPSTQGTPFRSAEQLAGELPPHVGVGADVTLPVVLTKEEGESLEKFKETVGEHLEGRVFNDPEQGKRVDNSSDSDED